MRCLGGRVLFLLIAVDQPRNGCFAKRDLAPSLGGQPEALPAADGTEPGAESVGVGELVDVFQAAQPSDLAHILCVLTRQPVLAGDPAQQRLVLIDQLAPGKSIPAPDALDQFRRIVGERIIDDRFGIRWFLWLGLGAMSLLVHGLTMASEG